MTSAASGRHRPFTVLVAQASVYNLEARLRTFVLLVMNQNGVDALLKGKTKQGTDASGAAGTSGATARSVGSDILTYGKTSGLFAGVSLGNATIEPDTNRNKRLYGKPATPREILTISSVPTPAAGQPLITFLNSKVAKHGR